MAMAVNALHISPYSNKNILLSGTKIVVAEQKVFPLSELSSLPLFFSFYDSFDIESVEKFEK